jgi:hypothetical protein
MSVGFGNARRPMAPTLPLIEKDFGTSRWQLAIESYTNFACSWKGPRFPQLGHDAHGVIPASPQLAGADMRGSKAYSGFDPLRSRGEKHDAMQQRFEGRDPRHQSSVICNAT